MGAHFIEHDALPPGVESLEQHCVENADVDGLFTNFPVTTAEALRRIKTSK